MQAFYGCVGGEKDGLDDRVCDGLRRHHLAARSLGPERGPDLSVGCAGEQGDDADSAGTEFLAKGVGEAKGSVLGSVVGGRTGEYAVGGNGEIVPPRFIMASAA